MLLIKKPSDIKSSEITSESAYQSRRQFIKSVGQAALLSAVGGSMTACAESESTSAVQEKVSASTLAKPKDAKEYPSPAWLKQKFSALSSYNYAEGEPLTPYNDVTSYNNFYEFGGSKEEPKIAAQNFKTDPWSVEIAGECDKPGKYTLEDILKPHALEERIYRFRCVEAWSMVVPWVGFSLADLIKRFAPTSKAKYVELTTLYDPDQMPDQASFFSLIRYPYVEGLTIAEAMSPLTLMAVGLYGDVLPPQNGAPIRLIVPWKYGFKSVKSVVKIRFTERQPKTTWNEMAPQEYGFYANVNPEVNHPRWSQARERRLPNSLFAPNVIDTLPYNGYGEQVASLYSNLDLRVNY